MLTNWQITLMERRTTCVQKHNYIHIGLNSADADWIFCAREYGTSCGASGSVVFRLRNITDVDRLPEDGAEGKEESRC